MAIAKENKVVHGDDLTMIGQLIKEKFVQKENGKGLSTNDYTTADKNKVANIPSKTSDLTNDSGFITIEDVPEGAVPSSTTPGMDGTAAVGTETAFARGDHRHPTDSTRAPLASPALTGTPTAPTAAAGTNTTQIATTAFVKSAVDSAVSGLAGALKYKGTKASYAELPASGNTTGDVWNVTAAYGDVPAGTNWAWDGSSWDALGGDVDLSNYVTEDELEALTSAEVTALLNL